jgi:hypothetical protein
MRQLWETSQKLLKAFNAESRKLLLPDYDTLIDLNYDNIKDFVIGYYGHSGNWNKNKLRFTYMILNNVLNEQII